MRSLRTTRPWLCYKCHEQHRAAHSSLENDIPRFSGSLSESPAVSDADACSSGIGSTSILTLTLKATFPSSGYTGKASTP